MTRIPGVWLSTSHGAPINFLAITPHYVAHRHRSKGSSPSSVAVVGGGDGGGLIAHAPLS